MITSNSNEEIIKRETCRACGMVILPVLNLGEQWLSDFPDSPNVHPHPKVPLVLAMCTGCGLTQLQHTAPREWLYEEHYWYKSGINESMVKALKDVVAKACSMVELGRGDSVMDIGANDGTLLSTYPQLGYDINRYAFDPASNLHGELSYNCEILIPSYFPSEKYDGPRPKIITSIAMFYDLEDPNSFVKEIKRILHPLGVWVIQMSYLPAMLSRNAFDNICHEHLEYYSLASLSALLTVHGLTISGVELNEVNGGSFRCYVRHDTYPVNKMEAQHTMEVLLKEVSMFGHTDNVYAEFARNVEGVKRTVMKQVKEMPIKVLYGASTKGNTLLQYFNLGPDQIDHAIERSPEKVGRFTVNGIPIVSEEIGRKTSWGKEVWLVLPWHFRESIINREVNFLKRGGILFFPLPKPVGINLEVVGE